MVRFYCLSSIKRTCPNNLLENLSSTEIDDYISNYYGNNTTKIMEKITDDPEIFDIYELTEISIGYTLNNKTKERIFLMFIYRKDTGLIVIQMIPGAVDFHSVSKHLHEFLVFSSRLFPNVMKFDLSIRVRCIKNTQVRGPITVEEEKCYEDFAEYIQKFSEKDKDLQETAFEKLPFVLPNESKPNVLRQKLSDISTFVKLLCDEKTGSFANIPKDARYNQKLKCSLLDIEKRIERDIEKDIDKIIDRSIEKDIEKIIDRSIEKDIERRIKISKASGSSAEKKLSEYTASSSCASSNGKLITTLKRNHQKEDSKISCEKPRKKTMFSHFNDINVNENKTFDMELDRVVQLNSDLRNACEHFAQTLCHIKSGNSKTPDTLPNTDHINNVRPVVCKQNVILRAPASFLAGYEFANLEKIVLQNCNITHLPNFDIFSPSVTLLDLSDNSIICIPTSISRLTDLTIFNISGNRNLSDDGFPWIHLPSSLKQLNIKKTNITNIPPAVQQLKKLEFLKMGNERFENVSWEYLNDSLKRVTIKYSKIKTIGDISHFKNLNSLKAKSNEITYIPEGIINLQVLTEIELKNNNLFLLPIGFENLNSLKYLNLSNNKFIYGNDNLVEALWKRLPSKLSVLILNNNDLVELPCYLQNYNFNHLAANSCNLRSICPYFITIQRNNEFFLEIADNPKFENLHVIPKTFYQKFSSTRYNLKATFTNLNILTNKKFVDNSKVEVSNYEFNYCKNFYQSCKCCVSCGEQTSENMIKQIMIMDFNLFLKKPKSNHFYLKIFMNEKLGEKRQSYREIFARKADQVLTPGQWKTKVKTRLCPKCLYNIKTKINAAQQLYHRCLDLSITNHELQPTKKMPQTLFTSDNCSHQLDTQYYDIQIDQPQMLFQECQSHTIKKHALIIQNESPFLPCFSATECNIIASKNGNNSAQYPSTSNLSNSLQIKSEFSNSVYDQDDDELMNEMKKFQKQTSSLKTSVKK